MKECGICGKLFPVNGNQRYCSKRCRAIAVATSKRIYSKSRCDRRRKAIIAARTYQFNNAKKVCITPHGMVIDVLIGGIWKKRCSKCSAMLPLSAFTHNEGNRDGFSFYCSKCNRIAEVKRLSCPIKAERSRDRRRRWHVNNRDRARAAYRRRRAAAAQVNEDFTPDMERFSTDFWDGRCAICGDTGQLVMDHWFPLQPADGGIGHALSMDNAVLMCSSCNSKKHNNHPADIYSSSLYGAICSKLGQQAHNWLLATKNIPLST